MKLAKLIAQTGEQEAVMQVLCHLLATDRTTILLLKEIEDDVVDETLKYIEQYKKGTPLAYLLGYCYFYNRKFLVNKNVLVPRFDTEVLVELAEKKIITDAVIGDMRQPYRILDLCCGSGVIGISLACMCDWLQQNHQAQLFAVTAADISKPALMVTATNARLHHVDLSVVQSDLFDNINGKFDLIVCNPPYVRTMEIGLADQRVLKEPKLALDGGLDGLYYYRRILATAQDHLYRDGMLMFEIGYDQAEAVREIALAYGYRDVKIYKDLANHDRVVTIRI